LRACWSCQSPCSPCSLIIARQTVSALLAQRELRKGIPKLFVAVGRLRRFEAQMIVRHQEEQAKLPAIFLNQWIEPSFGTVNQRFLNNEKQLHSVKTDAPRREAESMEVGQKERLDEPIVSLAPIDAIVMPSEQPVEEGAGKNEATLLKARQLSSEILDGAAPPVVQLGIINPSDDGRCHTNMLQV
ncbi:MAG: hypothetical protein ACRD3N_00320, partial [Terracidiphilus sp.]